MKKTLSVAVVAALALLASGSPSRADPCAAYFCLDGQLQSGDTEKCESCAEQCRVLTADYFNIRIYSPRFNGSATARERDAYLRQCPYPTVQARISAVTSAFGHLRDAPAFFQGPANNRSSSNTGIGGGPNSGLPVQSVR